MAKLDTRFTSTRQDWTTPRSLFDPLDKEFGFTLDAAADEDNALCDLFFDKEQNALKINWGKHIVWVNPPFGGVKENSLQNWIRKGLDASHKGATVVMLVPARTNTEWFHKICVKYAEIRFVRGRPKFSGAYHGLPQPLCLIIFRPDRNKKD